MKKIIVVMLCILCVCLSGCDDGREAERRDSYGVKPIMTIYGKDVEKRYFYYAVDERTGVVYIMGGAYNRGYMSPALNADGTPMLRDQLKEMMQEKE
jgi:hypothetical protein